MENYYDIVIIGLGVAGSVFASNLNSKVKALAIDKKLNEDNGFKKPCGGLLAPDAQNVLARLGLGLPKSILVDPQVFSVCTEDLSLKTTRFYQRHYINIDRHKFDLWLKSQIPSFVKIENGAVCTKIERKENGFNVSYLKNGVTYSVFAKQIVGADGAASVVRRTLFKRQKIKKYIAIQQWFKSKEKSPCYYCFFDSKLTKSYAWALDKEDSLIFGGAFEAKNAKQSFEKLKEKLEDRDYQFSDAIKTEGCLVFSPSFGRGICFGRDNAFLLGEAAGLVSPSSLEGISYALESGYILSRVFNSGFKNQVRAYKKQMKKIKRRIFLKSAKSIFMYNPLLRKIIMKLGISTIKPYNRYLDKKG